MNSATVVITTINPITKGILKYLETTDHPVLLVGDKKTPHIDSNGLLNFYSLSNQLDSRFQLARKLPVNHYSRKNLGYLKALESGCEYVFDTDDDNIPYDHWKFPSMEHTGQVVTEIDFYNVYSRYTDVNVWPRGYPLNRILSRNSGSKIEQGSKQIGVWQGLADIDPDVDAIYRLTDYKPIHFKRISPIALDRNVYCPFNSQNTWWVRDMIPYAYLPSTVTFRFTDILRGYIAQRCLWAHQLHLGFTEATVYQERNEHNLMKDFESEIPCYLEVETVCKILDDLELDQVPANNLRKIYTALHQAKIVQQEELELLDLWISDLESVL